jgi:hypothetical protein
MVNSISISVELVNLRHAALFLLNNARRTNIFLACTFAFCHICVRGRWAKKQKRLWLLPLPRRLAYKHLYSVPAAPARTAASNARSASGIPAAAAYAFAAWRACTRRQHGAVAAAANGGRTAACANAAASVALPAYFALLAPQLPARLAGEWAEDGAALPEDASALLLRAYQHRRMSPALAAYIPLVPFLWGRVMGRRHGTLAYGE